MNILNDTCSRFGLSITISFPKTNTQVFNNDELTNLPSLFLISENVVENVSEFTYLGQTFSNKDQGSCTDLRVSKAIGKFNEMRQVLMDQKVNMTTRTILMGACVRSRLLYGTQAQYINEQNIRKLETCQIELLRQIVNSGWNRLPTPEDAEDTEFRLRYTNTDILHVTENNSLRNVIRSQYLKHIGRVCHCSNTTLTKKMLFAKRRPQKRDPRINIGKLLNVSIEQANSSTQNKSGFAVLVDRLVASATSVTGLPSWRILTVLYCTVILKLI